MNVYVRLRTYRCREYAMRLCAQTQSPNTAGNDVDEIVSYRFATNLVDESRRSKCASVAISVSSTESQTRQPGRVEQGRDVCARGRGRAGRVRRETRCQLRSAGARWRSSAASAALRSTGSRIGVRSILLDWADGAADGVDDSTSS